MVGYQNDSDDLQAEKEELVNRKSVPIGFLLGYLVPGMGHFYLGRVLQGVIFMVCILSAFLFGLWLGGGILWYELTFLSFLGFVVKFFAGLPFFAALMMQSGLDNTSPNYEIGTALMLVAGALNILVLIHLLDIAFPVKQQPKEETPC